MKNRTEMIYWISSQFLFFYFFLQVRVFVTSIGLHSQSQCAGRGHEQQGAAVEVPLAVTFFLFFFCFNCSTCLCISSCLWMGVDLTLSCLAQAGSIVCHAGPHDAVRHVHTAVSPRSTAPPASSQPRESWVSTQIFLREFMFEQNVTFLSYRTQCSIKYAKKLTKNTI